MVKFHIVINTPKGALFCTYFRSKTQKSEQKALANADENKSEENTPKVKKSVALAHDIFGHVVEEITIAPDKHLGYNLTIGSLKPCKLCAMEKAKKKNIIKSREHVTATKSNERVFLDISAINKPNNGQKFTLRNKNWRIILEELSGVKMSYLYDTKKGLIETTCECF